MKIFKNLRSDAACPAPLIVPGVTAQLNSGNDSDRLTSARRSIPRHLATFWVLLLLCGSILAGCGHSRDDSPAKGPRLVEKTAGDITTDRNGTRSIRYGTDVCATTGKPIDVVRYGAILNMKNGVVHKFNSAESMAAFMIRERLSAGEIRELLVVDFASGSRIIPVGDALYLHSSLRPSPGKMNITPVDRQNSRMLENIYNAYPGTWLEWNDVVEMQKLKAAAKP